jgi:hypothetical protein
MAAMKTDTVAGKIIDLCGGPEAVAAMLGMNLSSVYRWTYRDGGLVPVERIRPLILAARERGITLQPSDFFEELPPQS